MSIKASLRPCILHEERYPPTTHSTSNPQSIYRVRKARSAIRAARGGGSPLNGIVEAVDEARPAAVEMGVAEAEINELETGMKPWSTQIVMSGPKVCVTPLSIAVMRFEVINATCHTFCRFVSQRTGLYSSSRRLITFFLSWKTKVSSSNVLPPRATCCPHEHSEQVPNANGRHVSQYSQFFRYAERVTHWMTTHQSSCTVAKRRMSLAANMDAAYFG